MSDGRYAGVDWASEEHAVCVVDERAAAVTLSAMVGAVMIARALGSTNRSDEILGQVRDAVAERRVAPASAD